EMGQQLLATGERAGDSALLLLAHRVLGQVVFFQGEFGLAWSHLEQATRLYDPDAHRALTAQYAQDPGVAAHSYGSLARWALGHSDRAAEHERAALTLAREMAHPYTLAFALSGAVWLHQFRGEPEEVQKHVDELIALSTEHGYAYLRARG